MTEDSVTTESASTGSNKTHRVDDKNNCKQTKYMSINAFSYSYPGFPPIEGYSDEDRDPLIQDILDKLPQDMINYIYIWWFRLFWRNYRPNTALVPTWYKRHVKIEKKIWEAKEKNIHFMHLPFNTLQCNKKWIPGCQCDYCKNYETHHKKKAVLKVSQIKQRLDLAPDSGRFSVELYSKKHNKTYVVNEPGLKENLHFDCFYDTPVETYWKYAVRHPDTEPLGFTEEIS